MLTWEITQEPGKKNVTTRYPNRGDSTMAIAMLAMIGLAWGFFLVLLAHDRDFPGQTG